jgi:uncharacterized protein (TIGR02145 family)
MFMKKNSLRIISAFLAVITLTAFVSLNESTYTNALFKEVVIGNQVWMAVNLDVDKFRNGEPIFHAKTKAEWRNAARESRPAWSYYDFNPDNGLKYGKLYNWYAVNDPRGLAPKGWHIPEFEEWNTLVYYMNDEPGKKMKSADGWFENGNGSNESGFSGLPGGEIQFDGSFGGLGKYGYWWSSTLATSLLAKGITLRHMNSNANGTSGLKEGGYSVRCVRD